MADKDQVSHFKQVGTVLPCLANIAMQCIYNHMRRANDIRKGALDDDQWERFQGAKSDLSRLPLHIDDTAGLTIDQIRARALRP